MLATKVQCKPCTRATFAPSRTFQPRKAVTARVMEVNEKNFEAEVLKANLPVVVEFWAAWCGPCRLVGAAMEAVEKDYAGKLKIVKVEHDANKELITKYRVYGLPTFVMIKNGEEVKGSHYEGAVTKPMLVDYVKKFL